VPDGKAVHPDFNKNPGKTAIIVQEKASFLLDDFAFSMGTDLNNFH